MNNKLWGDDIINSENFTLSSEIKLDQLRTSPLIRTMWLYSAYKKKVGLIHIQKHIVLKSINLNICIWPICKEQLIIFPLVYTLLASCMSRMTDYIAIEDDNVISHLLQVLVIGRGGSLQWMPSLVMQMNECLVIKLDAPKLHLKVLVIIARYQNVLW